MLTPASGRLVDGVAVGVAALASEQVQSVSAVQLVFRQWLLTQSKPVSHSLSFVHESLHDRAQVQSVSSLHSGFLHLPATHSSLEAQSLFEEQVSLH